VLTQDGTGRSLTFTNTTVGVTGNAGTGLTSHGDAVTFALAANDFMYWEIMREACIAGYRSFDFGRSRVGSGSRLDRRISACTRAFTGVPR